MHKKNILKNAKAIAISIFLESVFSTTQEKIELNNFPTLQKK
jgi:hypothetical protein